MSLARIRDQARKQDTRHKIELGGLVIKAGLSVEDRAVLLGALLDVCGRLNSEEGEALRLRFMASGKQALQNNL